MKTVMLDWVWIVGQIKMKEKSEHCLQNGITGITNLWPKSKVTDEEENI